MTELHEDGGVVIARLLLGDLAGAIIVSPAWHDHRPWLLAYMFPQGPVTTRVLPNEQGTENQDSLVIQPH